jgi:hypothetical protein
MGRPTIGKQAMTSTERQRRYWQRVLGMEQMEAKLKVTRQRIRELEAALAARD